MGDKKRGENISELGIIIIASLLFAFFIYFVSATYIQTPYTSNSCLVNARENITLYGDTTGAFIKFTSALAGSFGEKTLRYALDSDNTADASLISVNLTYSAGRRIVVKEGQNAYRNDYVIINSGDYGRILVVSNIPLNATNAKIRLTDVITSETFDFETGIATTGSLNIDGQTYYIAANNSGINDAVYTVNLTWGTSASAGNAGTETTLFPRIKLNQSEWFAILYESTVDNSTKYALPGERLLSDYESGEFLGMRNSTSNIFTSKNFSSINYTISQNANGSVTGSIVGIDTDKDGVIDCNFNSTFGPAILLLEGQNASFSSNAICIPLTQEGTNPKTPAIGLPKFTEGSVSLRNLISNANEYQALDSYGTFLRYDLSNQNNLNISYPYNWMADYASFTPEGFICNLYRLSEDSRQVVNITINNTNSDIASNITQVNITIPSLVSFITNSNGTSEVATFTNTSTVLSWSSQNGLVMNLSAAQFWFSTDSNTTGTYNTNVTVVNSTGLEIFWITFTVNDTSSPSISFVSPTLSNGGTFDRSTIPVNVSISDNNETGVLIVNLYNSTGIVNTSIGNSTLTFFNFVSLSYGTYYINATVNDTTGNINNTETRTVTLSAASSSSSSSSSGGSSGGGATSTSTYTLNAAQSLDGTNKNLGIGDKINFVIGVANHVLNVTKVNSDSAEILIRSNPITLLLKIGESKKLSLSSTNYYDLYVKLESISGTRANITMKTIQELIPEGANESTQIESIETNQTSSTDEPNNESDKKDFNFNLMTTTIIFILLLLVYLFYYFYKRIKGKKN
jgi:hypothetical protein